MTETLTVILPTRDRADTLKYALQTVTSQTNPNIEIIISDNFSGPEVKAVADACDDKRLRYIRTESRMGMSEHYGFAVSHATGDWVTIIGDDDGLLPGSVDKFFALAEKHPDIKAITPANCFFRWPTPDGKNGKLQVISGKGYEIRDCDEYMRKTLEGDAVSQPTIYGGFVHKDVIKEWKDKSPDGRVFNSMNPDIYSGFAICSITDKYIYSWEAWGIDGISKHSNGVLHKELQKNKELDKLDFYQENAIKFHESLISYSIQSVHILLYESFIQSAHLRDDDFGITMENQLAVAMALSNKKVKDSVYEYGKQVAEHNGLDFESIKKDADSKRFSFRLKKLIRKLKALLGLSKLPRKNINYGDAKTIYDASVKAGEYV